MVNKNKRLFWIEFYHIIGFALIFGYMGATDILWSPLNGLFWTFFGIFLGYLLAEHVKERRYPSG